jgi:hypothetical protein
MVKSPLRNAGTTGITGSDGSHVVAETRFSKAVNYGVSLQR